MDTKSATILATGRTVNLPESEEQPVAAKPLTEIQIHAVDLSLKSSQSLPPYSQPLHFKDTHGLHCETKKANRGKKRRRSSMEGEEAADNITHTAVDPGVQKSNDSDSILPETDSIDTSGKETHSHSLVVLKDEIEEVCIGDSHGCWQGDSYPPVFLSKIKAEDKGSEVTSNDSDDVAEDAFGTIKEEHGDVVMDEVRLLAKDVTKEKTTVSERQVLDLTGIIKSNSLTGLSAELGQGMENCSCKNELSDSMPNSDEERNGKEEAGFPLVQDLGKRKEQRTNEPDTGTVDKENEVIQKMEGEEEALNLSLSQKAVRSHTPKMEKYAEDGTGSQSTLVMEVDEIMQREEDEEEEQDDDSQTLFDKEPAVVRVNVPDWAPKLSPASVSVHNSPTSSTAEDLDGLLLIDDQGIPYTLMPDGKKVIQVAQSKSCKASTLSQTKLKARRVEAKDSQTASSPDRDLPKKGVTEALTCPSSKERTPQLSTSGSAPKIVHLNNKPTSQTAVIAPASLSPSLSNLASQPVKILANPTSNILLVPSSHLPSPQSAKPTSNASLLTLSLPISLNPNPPSAPLFLVLSPLTASSTPPSSSSSKVNVIDSIPSPLLPSNMQSSASALVPLSSGKTVTGSSSPSSGSLLVDELNSGTPSTSIVGNGTGPISTPDSPSISSGNTRQPKPDLTSKTALPKLSRVIKSESPSNPDSTNVAANQTESSTSPVPISSSPVKSPESNSLRCTSTSSVCQTSKDSPPAPISDTLTDIFPFDQSHYERSGTPPPTAIFPTNHPKNFSLSSSCTRRILYCQYCPRAFYYLSDLERHSITHSQSKPYVCPLCNKAFKRSSHLERHKHIHTGQRNFICPICSKRFREAGELLRHQRVHTGEKPFQCPQCHMRFAERNTLRRHTKRKHHELNGHGDGEGMPGGQEESAEWYSCAVPDIDSDTEPDKD